MNASKFSVALAAVVICTAWAGNAFATQPGNNGGGNGGCGVGQQTNGCGSQSGGNGGAGGQGGAGGNGSGVGLGVGIGYSQSDSKASANSISGSYSNGGDAKATGGSANSSNSNSVSGYGGSATGNGAGNSTNVNFEGSTYKEAAQTAYAPTPSGPRTSCRIFIGFGGSSTSGSLSGGVPLLNDGLCVAGAQVEFMNTVNKIQANTFSVQDYLVAVCAVEGMDKMAACKK